MQQKGQLKYALVAQLDRALDYESRGQGFESSRAHQFFLFSYHKGLLKFDTSTHQEN